MLCERLFLPLFCSGNDKLVAERNGTASADEEYFVHVSVDT